MAIVWRKWTIFVRLRDGKGLPWITECLWKEVNPLNDVVTQNHIADHIGISISSLKTLGIKCQYSAE